MWWSIELKKGLFYAKKMREEVVPDEVRKPDWGLVEALQTMLRILNLISGAMASH